MYLIVKNYQVAHRLRPIFNKKYIILRKGRETYRFYPGVDISKRQNDAERGVEYNADWDGADDDYWNDHWHWITGWIITGADDDYR